MARYTSNTTISIPANAINITITVAAARGRSGGNDAEYSPGEGGAGRVGTFTLPDLTPRSLTFNIGKIGGVGVSSQSNAAGGSGGSGVASGGTGGRAGPQGSSGGGGGGGGATGVYDSLSNSWIIVAGGGGGGGGAAFPGVSGFNGGTGLGWGSSVGSITNGGTGGSCPTDGSGGGGGGGGASGGAGGSNGFDVGAGNVRAQGGGGGGSGYRSSTVSWTGSSGSNFGDGYVDVTYTLVSPSIDSYTANPSAIIRGQSSTLSWSTSNATSVSISGVGNVAVDGSTVVSPQSTATYTLTASGFGQTVTRNITVTVYIPPVITLSLAKNSIIAGQCTTLSWNTTGDADTIEWLAGNINNFNLTSSATVCPLDTTIYTAKVSGLGGQDTDSIALVVNQIPTLDFSIPEIINYGDPASVSYESKYSNISLNLKVYYIYTDESNVLIDDINLPNPSSAQLNGANNSVSGTRDLSIQYNDFGPRFVDVVMTASGSGGEVTLTKRITVEIDETPDNIIIPETEDKFKSQDPVFTPETEILSELLLVDDIDIPVEVKASSPIQIDINGQNDWKNLRQI